MFKRNGVLVLVAAAAGRLCDAVPFAGWHDGIRTNPACVASSASARLALPAPRGLAIAPTVLALHAEAEGWGTMTRAARSAGL